MPAKILILATGGTIACLPANHTGDQYRPANLEIASLIETIPGIQDLANLFHSQFSHGKSNNFTDEDRIRLANEVNKKIYTDDFDGIVITHGTNTLEENAYFLNLVIKSDKSIVITGAMRPAMSLGEDGKRNLYNAIALAASGYKDKGILITFNDRIIEARDLIKQHINSAEGINANELGIVGYIQNSKPIFYKQTLRKHTIHSVFDVSQLKALPKVHIVYSYYNNKIMFQAAIDDKASGIIIAGMGKGYESDESMQMVAQAREKGIVIVRTPRSGEGIVTLDPKTDSKYGLITGDNLNPIKARILLALCLSKTNDPIEIQSLFNEY